MTRWIAGMMALGIILGACGGDDASTEVAADFQDASATIAEEAPAVGGGEADGFGIDDSATRQISDAVPADRKVIKTGQITITAPDTRKAMDGVITMVERSGGYVAASEVTPSGEDRQPEISVTIRVPAGEINTALAAIRELADEVISESIQSQDVTEEYVDIEARIRNLTALETELVALLAEVREQPNADPQKLLAVFSQVSEVRGEIEILEGRRRLLDNQADLSTISVYISPTATSQPIVEEGWAPLVTLRRAAGDLLEALQTLGDAAIWFVVFALPVVALFIVPAWALIRFMRRLGRRSTPESTPEATPPAPEPVTAAADETT
ncbi:MAG: DUF4349 domain-containing protein [Acidimicrobiia bacterium]|nr:DUF4349 domain-containing protein [Acidimicrobiia bacterium]